MFETPHDFDERTEIAISEAVRLMVGSIGPKKLGDMLLPYIIANEAAMAAKFGVDHPSLRLLEEYKEEVRLGKREPLVGDSKVRWVSDS